MTMENRNSNNGENFKLVGSSKFVRTNPKSDRFTVKRFHHVEFWCGDATNTARRFSRALGMPMVAKSDLSTGNFTHASYLLRSGEVQFLFTAPYSPSIATDSTSSASIPTFDRSTFLSFSAAHGLAVRAVAVEVCLYGDVVFRYISYKAQEPDHSGFLPGFVTVSTESDKLLDFGIRGIDHAAGNVPELQPAFLYVKKFTGFHEFAEFTTEEVGTSDSGFNSAVLANNNESVLIPINEPVYGTKWRSQIQTFLEHNEGPGVQHLALISEDIFRTLKEIKKQSGKGGFELMGAPPPTYYKNLRKRVGDVLSETQINKCEEFGVLVDRDHEGTLLQILTKPLGDRPTLFMEIIQRVGCMRKDDDEVVQQKGGCGGFGKGNFAELFKSVEEKKKKMTINNGNGQNTTRSTTVEEDLKLVGFSNFVRTNPKSDRFTVKRFHHVEFWCGDATNTALRFSWGLGMPLLAKSDLSTGNSSHASYLLRSGELDFLFTAPYSPAISTHQTSSASIPTFDRSTFLSFFAAHGLAVRAVALEVEDAEFAFATSVANGAMPSSPPINLGDGVVIAEVRLYGDVVLRYVSYKVQNSQNLVFLPGFESVLTAESDQPLDYGIRRLDHAVGNVPELLPAVSYVKKFTGFHEFAEFTAEDVGTSESGLNSKMLANNNETVLIPMNEPVHGTKRKSQIQTFLEHNEGPGIQHLALASEDIFGTLREMRKRSGLGGFEFMPSPPPTYYKNLKNRAGDVLTETQIQECEELGVLVDRDDQGTLLQIFTKPIGDRPTIFIEIIQRVGCMVKDDKGKLYQKGGCGGFGKGNISELFKCVEEYEKTLLKTKVVT
ncbi:hypothetical protein G4B88_007271 [Cannabis sativa]|uniref:4-hydroxyphenylpyruvate dioxygenase n=1 Tax=Cannabis sativa TaxID=3483 RepID=A0A7J6FRH6_CANSA|nr:hypothetical protein G4B88_007271 [Cannabis sativa]